MSTPKPPPAWLILGETPLWGEPTENVPFFEVDGRNLCIDCAPEPRPAQVTPRRGLVCASCNRRI